MHSSCSTGTPAESAHHPAKGRDSESHARKPKVQLKLQLPVVCAWHRNHRSIHPSPLTRRETHLQFTRKSPYNVHAPPQAVPATSPPSAMALTPTPSFSTSLFTRLQTASCSALCKPSCTSAINAPSSSSTNNLAPLGRSSPPASSSEYLNHHHARSFEPNLHAKALALCCAPRQRLVSQRRRDSGLLLNSDFVGSASWSRRIVGGRWHPSQHLARGRVLQVRAARMESGDVKVGFRAPDFELPEPLTGKTVKLDDFEDQQGLLVMFICNHCPFVIHLKEAIAKFAQEYGSKGLGIVAISSNSAVTHPQDGPQRMAQDAKKFGYAFPYLYDETQEVAKAFGAVCTPDFFLFKKDGRRPFELVYHGRFDETRPSSNSPITGRDLRAAVDSVLKGLPVKSDQKPSIGCSIKWHPGK